MAAAVTNPFAGFRQMKREQWIKTALLFSWFFLAITAFWLLKPVRVAALLSRLGAAETPYVKIASMVVVGVVVAVYSRVVDKISRRGLALGVGVIFSGLFVAFWAGMTLGGEALRGSRAFVWAFYILADVYSTVMVAVFWTYTNDVVNKGEADLLYGPIGLGGILGGVVGGLAADALARPVGPTNLLLICAALAALCGMMGVFTEGVLKPPPRQVSAESHKQSAINAALEGARVVKRSRYLMFLVGILVAYEIASTLNDFAINVMFERSFSGRTEMTQMYGRLGWIINGTALIAQLVLVPLVLPRKRLALMLVPACVLVVAIGFVVVPVIGLVFALAATDNGLSYSVQQSTKETLYVPLSDVEKYKSKAFIDMFVQRAAKAIAAFAIIGLTLAFGRNSLAKPMLLAILAVGAWLALAYGLSREYYRRMRGDAPTSAPRPAANESGSHEPSPRASLA